MRVMVTCRVATGAQGRSSQVEISRLVIGAAVVVMVAVMEQLTPLLLRLMRARLIAHAAVKGGKDAPKKQK